MLYFELLDPDGGDAVHARMGADVTMHNNPRFRVRAAGSFEQMPGCPDAAEVDLSRERLDLLIEDPRRTLPCSYDTEGCVVEFEDDSF